MTVLFYNNCIGDDPNSILVRQEHRQSERAMTHDSFSSLSLSLSHRHNSITPSPISLTEKMRTCRQGARGYLQLGTFWPLKLDSLGRLRCKWLIWPVGLDAVLPAPAASSTSGSGRRCGGQQGQIRSVVLSGKCVEI